MPAPFIAELQSLASRFCRLDFAEDNNPDQLAERAALLSADGIEATREDLHFAEGFLTTLQFTWQAPLRLRVDELEQALGEYRVSRRGLTPETSYVFSIQGQPLPGFIHLTAQSADRQGRLHVREVSLRRIAPEPYMVEQGRAVRLIVLADFAAGEEPFGDPLAIGIGEGVDVNEALARLAPAVHFDVVNHVDPSENALHFHFSPAALADFAIDRLVWSIPQLAALIELRRSLGALSDDRGRSVVPAGKLIGAELPPYWQTRARAVIAGASRDAGRLISDIDRALGNQCEAILSHHRFKSLESAWLGLDHLAGQLDFNAGSQIDVFSCGREDLVSTFRRGVFEPEVYHRDGLPPALVVVDGSFGGADAETLRELANLSAEAEIPLVLGGMAEEDVPSRSPDRPNGPSSLVAGVPTRILLRETLADRPPRHFEYLPGRLAPETAVWGSGVWAFAAAAAQSIGRCDINDVSLAAAVPSTGSRNAADVCRERTGAASIPPDGTAIFHVDFVEDDQKLRIRSQADQRASQFRADLAYGPLRQTIYRLRHQHAHRPDREEVRQMIVDALNARLPGAVVRAAFRGVPQHTHLFVEVTPPVPIPGADRGYTLELPWDFSSP